VIFIYILYYVLTMNIQGRAMDIVSNFERTLTPSVEEIPEPSSWWSPTMVMLEDDPEIPLEMRLYCGWEPFKERRHGEWHFFAPHHVFRLPEESDYLIAQKPSNWLMFSCKDSCWKILHTGQLTNSAKSFGDIVSYL